MFSCMFPNQNFPISSDTKMADTSFFRRTKHAGYIHTSSSYCVQPNIYTAIGKASENFLHARIRYTESDLHIDVTRRRPEKRAFLASFPGWAHYFSFLLRFPFSVFFARVRLFRLFCAPALQNNTPT